MVVSSTGGATIRREKSKKGGRRVYRGTFLRGANVGTSSKRVEPTKEMKASKSESKGEDSH